MALAALSLNWVSDDTMLQVLLLMNIPEAATRPNIAHYEGQQLKSICLGMSARGVLLTRPTLSYLYVYKLLSRWLLQSDVGENFSFTSITINVNHASAVHRDQGNTGLSVGRVLGDFYGGQLCYFPNDDGKMPLHLLSESEECLVNTSDFFLLDGKKAHSVKPFEGERVSVIFFTTESSMEPGASKELDFLAEWQAQ